MPFRISFRPHVDVSDTRLADNMAASSAYPRVEKGVHPHAVAVVGGGPSLLGRLDELRAWPGDIWAINSMPDWLEARGIDSVLFSVDPKPFASKAKRAILASTCHPSVFEGRDVRMFDMLEHATDGVIGGVTTASRAPALALRMGYPGVAFFGCDSDFGEIGHVSSGAYQDEELLIVRANGAEFITAPDFLLQAENLALLMRTFPDYVVNKSDGLLAALLADEEWTTVAVSDALKKKLIETNGDSGLYDEPYEVKR
jgi:hypothetical protein